MVFLGLAMVQGPQLAAVGARASWPQPSAVGAVILLAYPAILSPPALSKYAGVPCR